MTVWGLNDRITLAVARCSTKSQQSSCAIFGSSAMHFRSRITVRQVIRLVDQTTKFFLGDDPQTAIHNSMGVKNSPAPVPVVPSPPMDAPITLSWGQGPCKLDIECRDSRCTLRHPKRARRAKPAKIPCKYLKRGYCRFGSGCHYKRDTNQQRRAPPLVAPPAHSTGSPTDALVLLSAPEPEDQIEEAQFKKRATEIRQRPENWYYS